MITKLIVLVGLKIEEAYGAALKSKYHEEGKYYFP